ncbi:50S ribosomal protein L4 [Candidatus Woesearchaeota archaeon]|nr:50S ribosomal protein L4 [Candidatus Woesearchaeota archaeon]
MKLSILSLQKKETGSVQMPDQFFEPVRFDLIKRAVLSIQNANRQPYGAFSEAGKRASAKLSRRRRKYRGSYGHGISRVPRKILSRRGTHFNWVGAFMPGTVGGRRAHPPKAEKIWTQKINTQERRKAIRSALTAAFTKELVSERGHKVPEHYPFIVEDSIQQITKTKELLSHLETLGFAEDLARCSERTIRPGRGKMRGRRYKTKKSLLLVVSGNCPLEKSAHNVLGLDIIQVQNLNAELLAPGCHAGRMTLFTQESLKKLDQTKLFMKTVKVAPKEEKK